MKFQLKNPPPFVEAMQNGGDEDAIENWMKQVSGKTNASQLEWEGDGDEAHISAEADGSGDKTTVTVNTDYIVWMADGATEIFTVVPQAAFEADYAPVPVAA